MKLERCIKVDQITRSSPLLMSQSGATYLRSHLARVRFALVKTFEKKKCVSIDSIEMKKKLTHYARSAKPKRRSTMKF